MDFGNAFFCKTFLDWRWLPGKSYNRVVGIFAQVLKPCELAVRVNLSPGQYG